LLFFSKFAGSFEPQTLLMKESLEHTAETRGIMGVGSGGGEGADFTDVFSYGGQGGQTSRNTGHNVCT
jgi:hypothetical protein